MRSVQLLWLAVMHASLFLSVAPAQTVARVVETFDWVSWASGWNKAAGRVALDAEHAPEAPKGKSLRLDIHFSGRGFEWFGVVPPRPLWLPGNTKTITLRYKVNLPGYTVTLEFWDGWQRSQRNGANFVWVLPTDTSGQWLTASFAVPDDWVRPIAIKGLNVHNWNRQNEAAFVQVWVDHLEAQTDLSNTDERTGLPLSWSPNPNEQEEPKRRPPNANPVRLTLTSAAKHHVFAGEKPVLVAQIHYWRPQPQQGSLSLTVWDFQKQTVAQVERHLSVSDLTEIAFPLSLDHFGWYQAKATLRLSRGEQVEDQLAFAVLPPPRPLTEEQKVTSPYGLNVHGGREGFDPEPFRKAGIVWFRDYAFQFEAMKQARGDGKFDGWPWYHQLLWHYEQVGAKVLACLQGAIPRPKQDGKTKQPLGPTPEWRRDLASFLLAFPQVSHWELDNEYELSREVREWEEAIGWRNYRSFHRAFGEIVRALSGGAMIAVEQGRAGIDPEGIRLCVQSGDFEPIQVVNGHHYCGADPPERNLVNVNPMPQEGQSVGFFFDLLRAAKQAAKVDGKERQFWLTEFGWDTAAGHVVSPYEQAIYLQRGWLLALAAGVDKAFWFYDVDAPQPKQFFDGCGLLTADGQPKLALCALAALTYLLPQPRYLGDINAGEGTLGYVFECEGKLVAALWSIETEEGPIVSFEAERLYDFLGNPLPLKAYRLRRAPIFAVGLSHSDRWFQQTAYVLETPLLVSASAGDAFPLCVTIANNRNQPIRATLRLVLPKGWQADKAEIPSLVPVGERMSQTFTITVPPNEPEGLKEVRIVAVEGEKVVKEMVVQVLVRLPIAIMVTPLEGAPGRTKVEVRLHNRSRKTVKGTLAFRLPASWSVAPESATVALAPGDTQTVPVELNWTTDWLPKEKASVSFVAATGIVGQAVIVPSALRLFRAPKVTIDGKLDEWSERWEIPSWVLRSTFGAVNARLFLAWAPEGLYIAAEVNDSAIKVNDPRNFWNGDCLELFLDTRGDKRPRNFRLGDHQFWFVPLCDEGRVYVGQWKRGEELPQTRYDLPNIKSAARKIETGYIMEVLLPAEAIHGFLPQAGACWGLNLNLTVKGKWHDREVYWHRPKDWAILHLPHLWGMVVLSE